MYRESKITDFHVHLFPDNFFEAIWRYFSKNYGFDVRYRMYSGQCIDYLRSEGVGTIVFSNYAHKRGTASLLNEWNLKILDMFDDLYCFAAYHPDDEDAAVYCEEMLKHPRVLGFKLHLLVQNFHPQDERLFALYERVIEKRRRILFHAGTGPVGNEFVGIGNFSGLMRRYPELQANIAHMGGLEFREFLELSDDHPGLVFDTAFSFIPGTPFEFDLDGCWLEKYKSRILYGSDFPNLPTERRSEIEALFRLNLSEEFYNMVFVSNGEKILRDHSYYSVN